MKADELRSLELVDLEAKVKALEEDLFKVRFQHATAQLSDTSKIGKAKQVLARAKTILAERKAAAAS
ncbi:MAG: 50S ribosomal protein L29 [Deltaproteobacteria bacterium]|nr:MAG: 50S ribosomal protein L29 [Deltaproteobacteria bacterium]